MKPGLTLAQHEELGAELQQLRAQLHQVAARLTAAYGPRHRTIRAVARVEREMADCSAELVQWACREHPDHPVLDVAALYQGRQQPAAAD